MRLRVEEKTEVSGIITGDEVEVKSACTGNQTITFDKMPSKVNVTSIVPICACIYTVHIIIIM